jgi:hypothetical protein
MRGLIQVLDPQGRLSQRRGEVIRALVSAYVTNHAALRARLTAPDATRQFIETTLASPESVRSRIQDALLGPLRRMRSGGRRRLQLLAEYLEVSQDFRRPPSRLRRKIARNLLKAPEETETMLRLAIEHLRRAEAGQDAVVEELRRVAFDCSSWTRKVMLSRALQTIAMLDLRAYRDLVYQVGGYGEGGPPGHETS